MEPNLEYRWRKCKLKMILKYSFVGFYKKYIWHCIYYIVSEFNHHTEFILKINF